MLVTLLGIVIPVRLMQYENAPSPMLVTLLGIDMLVRLVQSLNAQSPILVTLAPPKVLGITSAPLNPAGALKSVIVAAPLAIVYVSPDEASVAARTVSLFMTVIPMTIARLRTIERIRFTRVLFITFPHIYSKIPVYLSLIISFSDYSF